MSRLPDSIMSRLRLPAIAAPMLRVSGPDLVVAACNAGVIGAYPTANARGGTAQLDDWMTEMSERTTSASAPICPNLIIQQPRRDEHMELLVRHRFELVITSVGSPAPVVDDLHAVGTLVLSDVATLKHAKKAVDAGADGLILLTAGSGGQTGWMNPFAFVSAVRAFYSGPIVLAGGISDGRSLLAATALGCDLGYMGTKFIATDESMASDSYRNMLVNSTIDDVLLTKAFTGLPTNMLLPAIIEAGLDPALLDEQVTPPDADVMYGGNSPSSGPKRWQHVFSAGHSVSGVTERSSVAALVETTLDELRIAQNETVSWGSGQAV